MRRRILLIIAPARWLGGRRPPVRVVYVTLGIWRRCLVVRPWRICIDIGWWREVPRPASVASTVALHHVYIAHVQTLPTKSSEHAILCSSGEGDAPRGHRLSEIVAPLLTCVGRRSRSSRRFRRLRSHKVIDVPRRLTRSVGPPVAECVRLGAGCRLRVPRVRTRSVHTTLSRVRTV